MGRWTREGVATTACRWRKYNVMGVGGSQGCRGEAHAGWPAGGTLQVVWRAERCNILAQAHAAACSRRGPGSSASFSTRSRRASSRNCTYLAQQM
jgi:hypothetical protein